VCPSTKIQQGVIIDQQQQQQSGQLPVLLFKKNISETTRPDSLKLTGSFIA